jgi:hypothetical protein
MINKMCPFDGWPMRTYAVAKDGTRILCCGKCGFEATFKEMYVEI